VTLRDANDYKPSHSRSLNSLLPGRIHERLSADGCSVLVYRDFASGCRIAEVRRQSRVAPIVVVKYALEVPVQLYSPPLAWTWGGDRGSIYNNHAAHES